MSGNKIEVHRLHEMKSTKLCLQGNRMMLRKCTNSYRQHLTYGKQTELCNENEHICIYKLLILEATYTSINVPSEGFWPLKLIFRSRSPSSS